jgi:acetyl-CoA synthetase
MRGADYDELCRAFAWEVPERFNMGTACADRQVPSALALIEQRSDGSVREHTFGQLADGSDRLANGLAALGLGHGDRLGIVLPQRLETGLAHLAAWKLGAISVPLSGLFGPDALRYRLADAGASVVIVDESALERVADVAADIGDLQVIVVGGGAASAPHHGYDDLMAAASGRFEAADTAGDTPALLIYTSGTTGSPKGALHGHRVLLGHLPGFELMFDFFPRANDRVWTPADWAWIGGLMDALVPAWYHGVPVVAAARGHFDPQWAIDVVRAHRVRAAFLPPTALKLMRQNGVEATDCGLRAVMSGGEPLGAQMLDWARASLGVTVNEIYGQTEANLVVGNCAAAWPVRPGSMGRPYPGHDVAVLDAAGNRAPAGETGELAVRADDPVAFLSYWQQPDATAEKVHDGWLRTGDLGTADTDGYLHFAARADDVITSAGYRIGPAEIEECLMGHPAVAMAAVIGVPDEVRGHVVKAFVKLAPGHQPSADADRSITAHVRERLAAYSYPRHIDFVDELPLTTTGKIRRAELRRREAQQARS